MITERKKYIDVMKFMGICCLFLAHVQGPFFLEEIRGFDVPMMVLISGSLAVSSIERATSTKDYIFKRVKRLVFPTWIFLAFFYLAMILMGQKPQFADIIKSFCFQRDCGLAGGVWIIWVYLVCAVSVPFFQKSLKKKWFWALAIVVLVTYEVVVFTVPMIVENRILYYSFFTIIPYGILTALGMSINQMHDKNKRLLFICTVMAYLLLCISLVIAGGRYISISQFKYPARIYYLSYGVSVTLVLTEIIKRLEEEIPEIKIINFVSKHSLWIYLWQIMILTIVNYVIKVSDRWFLSWLILMAGSITITWIQDIITTKLYNKTNWPIWKYFKG